MRVLPKALAVARVANYRTPPDETGIHCPPSATQSPGREVDHTAVKRGQAPSGPSSEPQTRTTLRPSGLTGSGAHTYNDVLLVAQFTIEHFGNGPIGDAKTEGDDP